MDEFPLLRRIGYFATAGVGVPPLSATEAVAEFAERLAEDPEAFDEYVGRAVEGAREAFAELIGVGQNDVVIAGSGTLEVVERALRVVGCGSGRNVVTDDLEYPGLLSLVASFARSCGYELRIARHRGGRLTADDVAKLVDGETAAVVVSTVQWINGVRLDVGALGEAFERHGAYLIVDGIQEAGVRKPRLAGVDLFAAGAQKWLIAPFGAALAYVGPRIAERQDLVGVGNAEPAAPFSEYFASGDKGPENLGLSPLRGAGRFGLPGMGPAAGIVGVARSLRLLAELGIGQIEAIVKRLRDKLAEVLEDRGLKLLTPQDADWSGIILTTSGSEETDRQLHEELTRSGFRLHLRGMSGLRGLRFSPHFYVDEGWVERLGEGLRRRRR